MTNATICHPLLSFIHALNVMIAIISKLLSLALARGNLIAKAAVCASKHEGWGLRPSENRLRSPVAQQDMYRRECVFILSSLSAYQLDTHPADFC